MSENYLAALSTFLYVYALAGSPSWPSRKTSAGLAAKAEATLALAAMSLFGLPATKVAEALWFSAKDCLVKNDPTENSTWLSLALSVSLKEAFEISHGSATPLFHVAESLCQANLLKLWRSLFVHVISSTTVLGKELSSSSSSSSTTSAVAPRLPADNSSSNTDLADEVLTAMPPSSPLHALALLYKGVEAVGANQAALAIQIALRLPSPHLSVLASARAFTALVSGGPMTEVPTDIKEGLDSLAYMTIAWLSIRQAASVFASSESLDSSEAALKIDDTLQSTTVQLRKLLVADAFVAAAENADEAFDDAQARCVEGLIEIGRKAAGLDNLSDSGCEL